MLNNNHVQIMMGIIRAINEDKKLKGFKFRSEEELKVTEKKIISFINFYNKIVNFLVNNRVSIFIKEAFYLLNSPYQEYLFSDEQGDYLVDYQKGKTENGKTIVEFRTTHDMKYALNISKFIFFKKYYIKHIINRTSKECGRNGDFRFKKFLIYN